MPKQYQPEELIWGVEDLQGEFNVFLVQSKSSACVKYRVDLMAYSFNGSCTCPRFLDFGIATKLDKGMKPTDKTECEHIKRAKKFYCYRALSFDKIALDKQKFQKTNSGATIENEEEEKALF